MWRWCTWTCQTLNCRTREVEQRCLCGLSSDNACRHCNVPNVRRVVCRRHLIHLAETENPQHSHSIVREGCFHSQMSTDKRRCTQIAGTTESFSNAINAVVTICVHLCASVDRPKQDRFDKNRLVNIKQNRPQPLLAGGPGLQWLRRKATRSRCEHFRFSENLGSQKKDRTDASCSCGALAQRESAP